MVESASTIWRNYVTDGVPSSGVHKPDKARIREWGARVESGANGWSFDTRAMAEAASVPVPVDVINLFGCVTIDDLGGGCYLRISSEPSHLAKMQTADGAWWELNEPEVRLQHFAHLVTNFGLANENWLPAYNAARDYAVSQGIKIKVTGRTFNFYGQANTVSGLTIEWDKGAFWYPKAWSDTGSFITNVVLTPEADRVQSDVTLINPQLDGSLLPYDLASNDNAIGFAHGMHRPRILGGHIRNFAFSWSGGGAGGKAVNFEGGVVDGFAWGYIAENCGIAAFNQGYRGTWSTGELKGSRRNIFANIWAINCEAACVAMGIDTTNDPDGAATSQQVIFDGGFAYNCGHAPNRTVGSDQQKSGVFVFGEAENVTLRGWRVHLDTGYPASWPAGGSGVVGSGLTGNVGALVWGWGRNIVVEDITCHGAIDHLFRINRARALGEDSGPGAKPINCFNYRARGIRHYGTLVNVFAIDTFAAAKVTNANLSGSFEDIVTDTPTRIVNTDCDGFTGVILECQERSNSGNGKRIRGTLDAINDRYPTFAVLPYQRVDMVDGGFSVELDDDVAASYPLPADNGWIDYRLISAGSGVSGTAMYNINGATAFIEPVGTLPANTELITTALTTGTTNGTDGKFCLAIVAATKTLEAKNRRGANDLNWHFSFRH